MSAKPFNASPLGYAPTRKPPASYEALYSAIVEFVAKQTACTFNDIHEEFSGPVRTAASASALHKRLSTLTGWAWLKSEGPRKYTVYALGAKAPEFAKTADLHPIANSPPAAATSLVPPHQHDCMRGPVYRPDPAGHIRHGALDFMQLASHGNRC